MTTDRRTADLLRAGRVAAWILVVFGAAAGVFLTVLTTNPWGLWAGVSLLVFAAILDLVITLLRGWWRRRNS